MQPAFYPSNLLSVFTSKWLECQGLKGQYQESPLAGRYHLGQRACDDGWGDYEEGCVGDGVIFVADGGGVCAVWTGAYAERYH